VSRYQKGKTRNVKTNLDLLEQEIVSGSGICWAICKSAPHPAGLYASLHLIRVVLDKFQNSSKKIVCVCILQGFPVLTQDIFGLQEMIHICWMLF